MQTPKYGRSILSFVWLLLSSCSTELAIPANKTPPQKNPASTREAIQPTPATTQAAITQPTSLFTPLRTLLLPTSGLTWTIADFNNDGMQDLAASDIRRINVLFGDGKGGLTFAKSSPARHFSKDMIARDLNGDHNQDLATANFASNTADICMGDGGGLFVCSAYVIEGQPVSIAAAHFNSDGKLDLVISDCAADSVSVLLSNDANSFSYKAPLAVDVSPYSVAAGDFNSDSNLDIASVNVVTENISILLGDGKGDFAPKVSVAVGGGPSRLVVSDFNQDGTPDIATSNSKTNNVGVLLGDGKGGFAAVTTFAAGSGPLSLVTADFNSDGLQDLATTNLISNDISILLGDGRGSFAAPINFLAGLSPRQLIVGDLNSDQKPDLLFKTSSSKEIHLLLSQ